MKKNFQYALTVVLILAIISGIVSVICFANFMKPGVHRFAGYTKLDFQETVYFIKADTQQISGNSTVTVSGLVQPEEASGASRGFRGSMSVEQYPKSMETGYDNFFACADKNVISVTCSRPQQDDVAYWLHMSVKNPDIYAIYIYLDDGTSVAAYPGDNEQEALANFEAYWQWFRTLNEK